MLEHLESVAEAHGVPVKPELPSGGEAVGGEGSFPRGQSEPRVSSQEHRGHHPVHRVSGIGRMVAVAPTPRGGGHGIAGQQGLVELPREQPAREVVGATAHPHDQWYAGLDQFCRKGYGVVRAGEASRRAADERDRRNLFTHRRLRCGEAGVQHHDGGQRRWCAELQEPDELIRRKGLDLGTQIRRRGSESHAPRGCRRDR